MFFIFSFLLKQLSSTKSESNNDDSLQNLTKPDLKSAQLIKKTLKYYNNIGLTDVKNKTVNSTDSSNSVLAEFNELVQKLISNTDSLPSKNQPITYFENSEKKKRKYNTNNLIIDINQPFKKQKVNKELEIFEKISSSDKKSDLDLIENSTVASTSSKGENNIKKIILEEFKNLGNGSNVNLQEFLIDVKYSFNSLDYDAKAYQVQKDHLSGGIMLKSNFIVGGDIKTNLFGDKTKNTLKEQPDIKLNDIEFIKSDKSLFNYPVFSNEEISNMGKNINTESNFDEKDKKISNTFNLEKEDTLGNETKITQNEDLDKMNSLENIDKEKSIGEDANIIKRNTDSTGLSIDKIFDQSVNDNVVKSNDVVFFNNNLESNQNATNPKCSHINTRQIIFDNLKSSEDFSNAGNCVGISKLNFKHEAFENSTTFIAFLNIFNLIEQDLKNIMESAFNYVYEDNKDVQSAILNLSKPQKYSTKIQNTIKILQLLLKSNIEEKFSVLPSKQKKLNYVLRSIYTHKDKTNLYTIKQSNKTNQIKKLLKEKKFDMNDFFFRTIQIINVTKDKNIKTLCILGLQNMFIKDISKNLPRFINLLICLYSFNYEKDMFQMDWEQRIFKILSYKKRSLRNLTYFECLWKDLYHQNHDQNYRMYLAMNAKNIEETLEYYKNIKKNQLQFYIINYLIDLINNVKYTIFQIKY